MAKNNNELTLEEKREYRLLVLTAKAVQKVIKKRFPKAEIVKADDSDGRKLLLWITIQSKRDLSEELEDWGNINLYTIEDNLIDWKKLPND